MRRYECGACPIKQQHIEDLRREVAVLCERLRVQAKLIEAKNDLIRELGERGDSR